MFNPEDFLAHLRMYLRGLGVDLTHTSGNQDSIVRCEGNPRECYLITIYCHTRDYPRAGDHQPAHKLTAYIYPQARTFHLCASMGGDEWNDTLWPSLRGYTPAEHTIRSEGVVDQYGNVWEVETI